MATQRRRDGVGRSGLGESGSSGDNNGSSKGERMGASQRWNTRHVRTACRGQLPHPIGQVRVQGVDGRERQLCPTVVPPGLERVSGGRAGRRITNLYSTTRVAGNQRAIGGEIPLNVISPKSHAFLNSCYGNLPAQLHHAGEQVVLVNPGDAIARNIGEGSAVRIFNDRGRFEAIAKVSAEVMEGLVVAPLGYWRDPSRAKATVNALNPSAYADLGRAPTFSDTLVQVAIAQPAAAAE